MRRTRTLTRTRLLITNTYRWTGEVMMNTKERRKYRIITRHHKMSKRWSLLYKHYFKRTSPLQTHTHTYKQTQTHIHTPFSILHHRRRRRRRRHDATLTILDLFYLNLLISFLAAQTTKKRILARRFQFRDFGNSINNPRPTLARFT